MQPQPTDRALLDGLLADLTAEHADLDRLVAPLTEQEWDRGTPAEGWTIRDTVSHLAFFEERAATAAAAPEDFLASLPEVVADLTPYMDRGPARGRSLTATDVLGWWRTERGRSLAAFRAVPPGIRVPWYGPPMSVASFATARLMETWAHGQDVADALHAERQPTPRLRHVVRIGALAVANSFLSHGRPVPVEPVRVAVTGPGGEQWVHGPEDADNVVTGPALDFCLVVTQRRHRADTELVAAGAVADAFLDLAQAFAGPPGSGRAPTR